MADEVVIKGLMSAVERAAEALEVARADLASHFEELGRRVVQTGELQVSLELGRVLYWDCPLIQVRWIALALGIPTHRVHEVVGGSRVLTCAACGETWTDGRLSRTGHGRWRGSLCESCKAKDDAERRAAWVADGPRREAERAARVQRLAAGGYWIADDGTVVLPEGGWDRCGGCGSDLRRIDDPEAWASGVGVTFACAVCEDGLSRTTPTLARYVPVASSSSVLPEEKP